MVNDNNSDSSTTDYTSILNHNYEAADADFYPYSGAGTFSKGTRAYTLDNYQEDANVTSIYPSHGQGTPIAFAYLSLKLNGEAGEVGEAYAKFLRGDYDLTEAKRRISKELGDVLWYVSQLATELDITLGDVANDNIRKLNDRKQRGTIRGSGDDR